MTLDVLLQALENAQQLREDLHTIAVNNTVGQYSADSIHTLFTIETVNSTFFYDACC